jgi:hypothetical protein
MYVMEAEKRRRAPWFAPLPRRGIWTSLNLSRAQFLCILTGSLLVFAFAGGPVWRHAHESHFWRLLVSYLLIPPAVSWALWHNATFQWLRLVVASAVLSAIKLVLTALILVGIGIAT